MSGNKAGDFDDEFRDPPSSPVVQCSPLATSPATSPIPHSPPSQGYYDGSSSSPSNSPVKKRRRYRSVEASELSRSSLARWRRKEEKEEEQVCEIDHEIHDMIAGSASTSRDKPANLSASVVECMENEQCNDHQSSVSTEDSSSSESDSDEMNSSSRSSVSESENSRPNTPTSDVSSVYAMSQDSDCSDNSSSDDERNPLLYEGAELTNNEALYEVLQVYMEERWTKISLNKNVKLIKKLMPQPNEFPASGKAVLKLLKDLTVESYGEQEFSYCAHCLQPIENGNKSCADDCDCDEVEKFYIFSPDVQIKHMFEQRELAKLIDRYKVEKDHAAAEGDVCDITDGTVYKSVKEHLQGQYDIVVLWNTDGVSMSGSSKQELWPILGTICEVPPQRRMAFMIVFGVFVGRQKPNMNIFLKPFVNSLQKCYNECVTWVHPVTQQCITSKIVAPLLSADAPAKAMVVQMERFNSKYGCNICEQKSKRIPLTDQEIRANEMQTNPRKRIRRQRRFVFQEDEGSARIRDGNRMDAQGALAERSGTPCKGVVGPAVVSDLPLFDRAHGVAAEYMHLLLLGVVKYFLFKIFFEKGLWYIGDKINEINYLISQIKVPDFVKRLPRGIDNFKLWKASEFRNFLLYYSLPVFKQFLRHEYIQHWLRLVVASYILLKDSISENEIKSAEIMLVAFVRDVGNLYGPKCYTYNVHNLIHLCLLVRRGGPLHGTSAFPFETFNGYIAARVHGAKHLGKELVNNINISLSVTILGNIVKACQELRSKEPKVVLLGKQCSKQLLSREELEFLSSCECITEFDLYTRAKLVTCIYTSSIYDMNKKRSNSYVQFNRENGQPVQYGEIVAFVKSESEVYCLLKTFKILHVQLFFHEESRFVVKNLVPVNYSGEFVVIPVSMITTKVLKVGIYLGIRPNSIEVNL